MKRKSRKRVAAMCTAAVVSVGMLAPALPVGAQEGSERLWDFQDGAQNWEYDDSWKGDAGVTGSAGWDEDKGMLKVDLDFSADVNNGWSQTGITAHAVLTADILAQLGETVEGRLALYAGSDKLQEISVIFNVEEAQRDPLCVDDFETYYGSSELLNSAWAVNKDSGCELTLSLTEDPVYDGEYALKFEYNEPSTGWAGATVSYEADWSSCNALQFWVVPDGKNQKTVIQINTADGGSYEAYLNEYEEYASSEKPLLVTMPFSEFVDKGGRGSLTSEAAADISGFGLWVNAISGSEAIDAEGRVSGTLYYDGIRAVSSESGEVIFGDPDQTKNPDAVKKPSDTGTSAGKGSQVSSVKTGDDSGDWIYMIVSGAVSLVLGAAVGIYRKRMR